MIALNLPFPPSLNRYWRHVVLPLRGGKSRVTVLISADGREYRKAVQAAVTKQGAGRVSGTRKLKVTLTLYAPDLRRRDLDNHAKAALDALTHAEVWGDDFQIDALHILRGEKRAGDGLLRVEIEPIPMALEQCA